MSTTLSNINWLALFPLGIVSLFFLWLGFRRGIRFFDHERNSSQKERFLNIFLFTFNIATVVFCGLIATSPTESWLVMIPCGLSLFIITIPISLLGGYYQLYVITGYSPKNSGIRTRLSVPNEKPEEKIAWYEFTPFAFIAGWLMFFLISIAMLVIGRITGKTQELYGFGTSISIIIGTLAGVLIFIGTLLKSKTV